MEERVCDMRFAYVTRLGSVNCCNQFFKRESILDVLFGQTVRSGLDVAPGEFSMTHSG